MPGIVQHADLTEDLPKSETGIAVHSDSLNSKETKKKRLFIQVTIAILKELMEKLSNNAFLRQKMLEDLNFQDKIDRAEAIKEAWAAFREALLREMNARLDAVGYSPELSKEVAEKLTDLSLQLQQLSEIRAELEAEETEIKANVAAVVASRSRIGAALAKPQELSTQDLEVLEEQTNIARKKVLDGHKKIEHGLRKHDEFVTMAKEAETNLTTLQDIFPVTKANQSEVKRFQDITSTMAKMLSPEALRSSNGIKMSMLSSRTKLDEEKDFLDKYAATIQSIKFERATTQRATTPFWAKSDVSSALVIPASTAPVYKK